MVDLIAGAGRCLAMDELSRGQGSMQSKYRREERKNHRSKRSCRSCAFTDRREPAIPSTPSAHAIPIHSDPIASDTQTFADFMLVTSCRFIF